MTMQQEEYYMLNAVPYYGRGVGCEGGWGVNMFYAVNPALYAPG